jgi:hypothetical protein
MIHTTLEVSNSTFEEIARLMKERGLWYEGWENTVSFEGLCVVIHREKDKPHTLRIAKDESSGPA